MIRNHTEKSQLKKGVFYHEFIHEDTGETVYVESTTIPYSVYILYKNNIPVYVGKTSNEIKTRLYQHINKKRDFDAYSIVSQSYMESVANIEEKVLISYLKSIYPSLQNKSSISPCGEIIKL